MTRRPDETPAGESQADAAIGGKRALLVGVRTYPSIPGEYGEPLAGCHNDVAAMRDTLLEWGFAEADVWVLIDQVAGCDCPFCRQEPAPVELPTRQGILSAVRELLAQTGAGDVVVVYYSGHGSEFAGRGLMAGQRFQTIVPHDSGRGDAENRDISDLEIEGWIRAFSEQTPYLTLIFDCCHSGGMSSLRGDAPAATRQVKADERTEAEAYAPELRESAPERPVRRLRGASGWLRGDGGSAIVLSASAGKELSSETVAGGKKHGLFTHHLTEALRRPETVGLTWADVFPEVAEAVSRENLSQNPRREGNSPIFEPGPVDPKDVYPPDVIALEKFAVVVGVDYQGASGDGFAPLKTPKSDAEEVARVLSEVQGYEIVGRSANHPGPLLNEKATRRRIHKVIDRLIQVKARSQRESAVVIYFAGHGKVLHDEKGQSTGYLIPWDADPEDPGTWLAMKDLRDQLVDGIRVAERLERLEQRRALARLKSRHLLLVLDCCFGGALSFDFFRGDDAPDRPIYYSEYKRFVEGPAWQLLTSASYNQQAMDRDPKDPDQPYSPFARAFIDGLTSAEADTKRSGARSDHVVTATELHQYVDARLKRMGVDVQTPGLISLRPLRGQFIFHVPGFKPSPLPDPPLDPEANPWRGKETYGEASDLYFGREQATLDLLEDFLACLGEPRRPALVVTGPSGCGKKSLVRAGLMPILDAPAPCRERLRSWLRSAGKKHYLISRKDLKEVREWAGRLGLGAFLDQPGELAAEVRRWAREENLLGDGDGTAGVGLESFGVPSFAESSEEQDWLRRSGLIALLDRPEELAERLRFWLQEHGIADFMTVSDRRLPRLVGTWKQADNAEVVAGGAENRGVLRLLEDASVEEIIQEPPEGEGTQTIAVVRADVLARWERSDRVEPAAQWRLYQWRLHQVSKPTRAELLDVVTGPASAGVLFFEPAELAERLAQEAEPTPTPLPLLSIALGRMYEQAWHRRRDQDRYLISEDLDPMGIAGLFGRRAEQTYRRLVARDRESGALVRCLFLRAVSLDGEQPSGRPVPWAELDLADREQRERFEDQVLQELVHERLVVSGGRYLELGCEGLLRTWKRLRLWVRRARRNAAGLHALWNRAVEWKESGYERAKLWIHDPIVEKWLPSTTLNRLEKAFLVASDMERRCLAIRARAAEAVPDLYLDWQHSAQLAAEAAELAVETDEVARRRLAQMPAEGVTAVAKESSAQAFELAWSTAEQTLHDVLQATPFSVPLSVPDGIEKAVALGFQDGELRLRDAAGRIVAWRLNDLAAGARMLDGEESPKPGENEAKPGPFAIGPFRQFPIMPPGLAPGPRAQTGHDKAVRYFADPRGKFSPALDPEALLGHRGLPAFLAFAGRRRRGAPEALASAANLPEGGVEVRYWPIRGPWAGIPGHPYTVPGEKLEDLFPRTDAVTQERWLIKSSAADGSSFVLRNQATGQDHTIELRRASRESAPRLPDWAFLPEIDLPMPRWIDDERRAPDFYFSPDGAWLAALSRTGAAWLWSLPALELRWSAEAGMTCMAFNPAPGADVLLAVGTESGKPWFLDSAAELSRPEEAPKGRNTALAFSSDGRRLAVGNLDGTVFLLTIGEIVPGVSRHPLVLRGERREGFAVTALAFFRHDRRLAVERRAVYDFEKYRLDVYGLSMTELIRLARGHLGRGLDEEERKLYIADLLRPLPSKRTLQEKENP